MRPEQLKTLFDQVAAGTLAPEAAVSRLRHLPFEALSFAKVDHHRHLRHGFPEVIFGQGKTPVQMVEIARRIYRHSGGVLITRVDPAGLQALRRSRLPLQHVAAARCVLVGQVPRPPAQGTVVVVTAGTADIPVAEEAGLTARLLGAKVETVYDAGVAGLHRVLPYHGLMEAASCIVVVAGMEGALASVVGGLTSKPVVAVPTSVGYGAALGGLSALLTMLNSCAPNVTVVNIDNGFGAGYVAGLINRAAWPQAGPAPALHLRAQRKGR